MASPHHHHQSSLEAVIDFSTRPTLSDGQRADAEVILTQLLAHCRQATAELRPYKWVDLLQLIQDYAVSERGRDNFIRYILTSVLDDESYQNNDDLVDVLNMLATFNSWDELRKESITQRLQEISDNLINYFFLPLKAVGVKTPQPTPTLTEPARLSLTGVTRRLSNLRAQCLIRDHHRCVITRRFDMAEAQSRVKCHGDDAKDDNGCLLRDEQEEPTFLEVSHIIPHSLMSLGTKGNTGLVLPTGLPYSLARLLTCSKNSNKRYVLQILDMFDPGITVLIDGEDIDRPFNAMSLTLESHRLFGALEVYFDSPSLETPMPEHTYVIRSAKSYPWQRNTRFPLARTLLLSPNHTIDPVSPRLLAVHRACALILHLSGAGDYIDKILRDEQEQCVQACQQYVLMKNCEY